MPDAEQLRAYAADLIKEQAVGIDYLAIFECAEDSPHIGHELDEDDGQRIADLISAAVVTVTWPDPPEKAGKHDDQPAGDPS